MQLVIPSDPSLNQAFTFVQTLAQRPELDAEPAMSDVQWEQAVTAAVSRGDRAGLGILLQVQLPPAIARAITTMGQVVRRVQALLHERTATHRAELAAEIEPAQMAVMRAGKAVWAGEHREGLLPDHAGPSRPRARWGESVWAKMATYLHMELASDDVVQAMAEDLGLALRRLIVPARAAIECIDDGELDDLLPYPLQQGLFDAFHALSGVRLYLTATEMADAAIEQVCTPEARLSEAG